MSDTSQEKAAEHADQALQQGKAAARNAGKAVKDVAEPVVDAVAEEVTDAAHQIEDAAQEAAAAARSLNLNVLANMSADTALGFAALGISIFMGNAALNSFRGVVRQSKDIIS